jgi:hypothetical protein
MKFGMDIITEVPTQHLWIKVAGSIPDEVIRFFNWPNPSSRTMALRSIQLLKEMSTRNLPGGKEGRLENKDDNVTAICESIV